MYTLRKRLRRVIEPKKFDRVFSILVNDKDFIIHPDSANKEFTEIYDMLKAFDENRLKTVEISNKMDEN